MKYLPATLLAMTLLLIAIHADAQTSAPKISMPNCMKPVTNGKVDTNEAADLFFKQLEDYKACIMKYVEVQRAMAAPYTDAFALTNKEFAAWVTGSPVVKAALEPPPAPTPAKR